MNKPRDVLRRWIATEGIAVHHIDVHADGEVAVWSQDNPRDANGSRCSWDEFVDGKLGALAGQLVGQDAYAQALAFVKAQLAKS